MADNFQANPGAGGDVFAADDVGGVKYPRSKISFGADGLATDVSATDPLPVSGPITNAQLRAAPVDVVADNSASIIAALKQIVHPVWEEAATGRLRVVLDPLGGAQTLGTVTTVTTVSTLVNAAQIGAVPANSFILDTMHNAWCNSVRRQIT